MKRKTAVISFIVVCAAIAILLITQTIGAIAGSILFAIALVLFGILSRGFTTEAG